MPSPATALAAGGEVALPASHTRLTSQALGCLAEWARPDWLTPAAVRGAGVTLPRWYWRGGWWEPGGSWEERLLWFFAPGRYSCRLCAFSVDSVPPGLMQLSHSPRHVGGGGRGFSGPWPPRRGLRGRNCPSCPLAPLCPQPHSRASLALLGHRGACEPRRVTWSSVCELWAALVFALAQWSPVLSLFHLAEEGTVLEVEGI